MSSHFPDGQPPMLPAAVAQIHRRLPVAGDIVARVGSRVEPDDTLGAANVVPPAIFLDAASTLAVEPQAVPRRVRRKIGEHLPAQQVIAKRGNRKLIAPVAGTIAAIDGETGFVVLTPDAVTTTLSASIRGYIADVTPNRAVMIETAAAVVQGVFGFGGEQFGVLRLMVTDRHDVITPQMIDARSAYAIMIGGAGITADALRKAQQEQVRGVIVGSMQESEVRAFFDQPADAPFDDWYRWGQHARAAQPPLTLLVTEGFGTAPMSAPIFDLLTRYDRQEALLDGTTTLVPPLARPRLVIPLPRLQGGQPTATPDQIVPGTIVRLVNERHLGLIGRVVAVQARGQLASGVRTATAMVQISETEQIVLPQTALEIIKDV